MLLQNLILLIDVTFSTPTRFLSKGYPSQNGDLLFWKTSEIGMIGAQR